MTSIIIIFIIITIINILILLILTTTTATTMTKGVVSFLLKCVLLTRQDEQRGLLLIFLCFSQYFFL